MTIHHHIARPLADVFAYVADSRNDVNWAPLVHGVEQVAGEGPGVGSGYEIKQEATGGKIATLRLEIAEFEPERRIVWRMKSRSMDYRSEMTFEADGDGTTMRQTNTVDLGSWSSNAVWRLMAPRFLGKQARLLKDILEQGPAARAAREG